ncbi:hypothetical protein E3T33_04050 [Cryobacterium sp. TMT1-2-1]|uniref:hypothetical protein n=1 Tax=Cryobacterium sp. TMT1-2-1 TaxID=1259232 RepID=UPI001069C257|nr:hypothetical protein [Cryobacterium sp. TMT1-2-1]TFD47034.1 hypothetical protein E3T33_04050 [Cryobacterium sp. TMT1-2-1]
MRAAQVAAVALALLSCAGPPAAYAADGPAGHGAVVVEADANRVGRPVAPRPEAAPPAPARVAEAAAAEAPVAQDRTARPGALDFVWLLPLGSGLAVLGTGWVLSRRNRNDDSD